MKRLVTLIAALAVFQTYAQRIEATLPSPDAKAIGMGGLMMTTLSGSHAIYNNSAMAVFSRMPSQISSSYYGQEDIDYYAVSGFCRFDNVNLAQIGWRQYLREHGNNDMAVDLGYSRRMGDNWALGIVARYMHLKRPEISADALAVDLSAAYQLPLENVGSYSTLRAGAKLGNLGGYVHDTDYTLPMDFTVGAALDTFLTDAHEITVGTDLGYYFSPSSVRGFQMSVGAEYNLMPTGPTAHGLPLRRAARLLSELLDRRRRRAHPPLAAGLRLSLRQEAHAPAQYVQHQFRTRFLRYSRIPSQPSSSMSSTSSKPSCPS